MVDVGFLARHRDARGTVDTGNGQAALTQDGSHAIDIGLGFVCGQADGHHRALRCASFSQH